MNDALHTAPQTAERSYGGQSHEYRTGDVLLFCGNALGSKIIRFGTKSSYSHAGIVYVWNGPDETGSSAEGPSTRSVPRVYCLEARGTQGVRLCLLSRLVADKHYPKIVYYRGAQLSDEQRNKAIGFSFAQLGKEYDHSGIRRFAWYIFMILVGVRRRMKPTVKRAQKTQKQVAKYRNDDMWFCSELVAAAYKPRASTSSYPQTSLTRRPRPLRPGRHGPTLLRPRIHGVARNEAARRPARGSGRRVAVRSELFSFVRRGRLLRRVCGGGLWRAESACAGGRLR